MCSDASAVSVLTIPYYDDNPYQRRLHESLREHGIEVQTVAQLSYLPLLPRVARERPDVLHLHWAHVLFVGRRPVFSVVLGLRLFFELAVCKVLGVSVVWTVHNTLHHERPQPRLELALRRLLVRYCDAIIVHGDQARNEIIDAYDLPPKLTARVAVIPHGHYIGSFVDETSRTEAREALDLPSEDVVCLFFGNIRPYKQVGTLVETFGRLETTGVRLVIAGRLRSAVRTDLVSRCREDDRVRTTFEFIPDDQVQTYMRAADVVVLPFSRVLTSGSVVLAMSFGKPVIAPRLGCIPETVAPVNDRSLLYAPDGDGLYERLRTVATDGGPNLSEIGRRNYERAREYDWNGIARCTHSVYRAAMYGNEIPTTVRAGSDYYDP